MMRTFSSLLNPSHFNPISRISTRHFHQPSPSRNQPQPQPQPQPPQSPSQRATTEAYKERIRTNDRAIRSFSSDARITVLSNTNTVQTAREKHGLSNFTTRLLGRALTAASLMASSLKGDERVILEWNAEGPLKVVYAEASRSGEVRGFVSDPQFDMQESTPLGYAMRTGILKASHILYNQARPYTSTLEIAGADIKTDVEQYYKMVDQLPTLFDIDTVMDPITQKVKFSGGILIQPLPQPTFKDTTKVIERYKNHLKFMPTLQTLFQDDSKSLIEILPQLFINTAEFSPENIEKHVIQFYCRCSKKEFGDKLVALSSASFKEMKEMLMEVDEKGKKGSISCYFCGTKYHYDQNELDDLQIKHDQAKK